MGNLYKISIEGLIKELHTDLASGLSTKEANERLKKYGYNELTEQNIKSPWVILWEQLTATMVLVLIFAAIVSAFLGDYKDAIAIMAIVILNALLGLNQEFKAEKAIAALKKLAVPNVKVRRDNLLQEISARELVIGDIVMLEAGNILPADCRISESVNLRVQESALTGESEAVEKDAKFFTTSDLPIADRCNMLYMGTVVTYGRGQAIVTDTGMNTELGRIATMIQTVDREPTPLQRRLDQVGRSLIIAITILVVIIFALGLLRGEELNLMLLTGVSLAVAAIPEALPAVVTITLALGAQRMLKRHCLIRKLPAVETLGSITVICSDKTGTLTENRMTVTSLNIIGQNIDLTKESTRLELLENPAALLLVGATLCNDAVLNPSNGENITATGDPTEAALVVAAANQNLSKPYLETVLPRISEVPFDSERKRMTTVHKLATPESTDPLTQLIAEKSLINKNSPFIAFTKGAVDGLLQVTANVLRKGRVEKLTDELRKEIIEAHNQITQKGKRVLGVAFRTVAEDLLANNLTAIEQELTFVGMLAMIDPARPEVKNAVLTCKTAGIRPIMITGDHPLTAQYIAKELEISKEGLILTGQDLDKLSLDELTKAVNEVSIFARVAPEHKLKIVQALQNNGQVVAMTGDGVNDAPALKKADIGVAMGITGTDVSKEASDMVLIDDNFATIVAAIEEGRVIYDNIKKYIKQTLTGNLGAIWVTLFAPLLGMPIPMLPLQILWLNLVADGLPSVALGLEPAEQDTMRRPPNYPNESIFSRKVIVQILWGGILIGTVLLGVGYFYWSKNSPVWQTMVLTTIIFSRMSLIMAVRSSKASLFQIGILSNKPLLGAVSLTILMQLAIIYVPFLQNFFGTVALSLTDLGIGAILSLVIFVGIEIEKWVLRTKNDETLPKSEHRNLIVGLPTGL
ncbi:MAG: cation-translocating P-type ATPase [Acidobacteria bacterium]|nr:cation-translocating P-type ATPase [Acidobacteriota bacterium]